MIIRLKQILCLFTALVSLASCGPDNEKGPGLGGVTIHMEPRRLSSPYESFHNEQ